MSGRAEPGICCDCWASDVCPAMKQMEKMREQRNESMGKPQLHYAAQLVVRRVRGKSAGGMSDQLVEIHCSGRKTRCELSCFADWRALWMHPARARLKYWAVFRRACRQEPNVQRQVSMPGWARSARRGSTASSLNRLWSPCY